MDSPEPMKPPKRRWRQFSVSTLLVVVTILGVGLGVVRHRAERQRRAVSAIRAEGGTVRYDFEESSSPVVRGELPGPDWLCRLLGVDYFAAVTKASLPYGATDATAAHLSGLMSLQELWLGGTRVTDAGLANLSGLTSLHTLRLRAMRVSDSGLAHLSDCLQIRFAFSSRRNISEIMER